VAQLGCVLFFHICILLPVYVQYTSGAREKRKAREVYKIAESDNEGEKIVAELKALWQQTPFQFKAYHNGCMNAFAANPTTAFISQQVFPFYFTQRSGFLNKDVQSAIRAATSTQSANDLAAAYSETACLMRDQKLIGFYSAQNLKASLVGSTIPTTGMTKEEDFNYTVLDEAVPIQPSGNMIRDMQVNFAESHQEFFNVFQESIPLGVNGALAVDSSHKVR
jgi:hypothetical protein